MKSKQRDYIGLRLILVGIGFTVAISAIGARAVYLQVFQHPWLSAKAANQYERSFRAVGARGKIFDRDLRELAISVDATSVAAYPRRVKNTDQAAIKLGNALSVSHRRLKKKLNSKKSFVWIKRQVTPKEAANVQKLNLEGIDFRIENKRYYPNKNLGAQLIGFAGIDGRGLEGIEFSYDQFLKGGREHRTVLKDALGRSFESPTQIADIQSGYNLILTLDRTIQYITEETLAETVKEFGAKSGMAIVMVPQTGAVLAMADYPFFNPNSFHDFNRFHWRNRAITDPFEPGSTLKIFSVAAAIESAGCTPNTIFFCENGSYRIGPNVVHDVKSHGWMSLHHILKYSSNIGTAKISEKLGPKRLYETLQGFGFGQKTGFDCPGETAGALRPYRKWYRIDTASVAFGQGLSVSALQLITATSAIANGGILMRPYVVEAITDQNGKLIRTFGPQQVRRAVSARTAESVKWMMQTVTQEGGTGVLAAVDGYSVCGKTGTAQKTDESGTYAKDKYISSFVGFAPADNPAIAVLIVINEPDHYYYGGTVAAPAFRKITHATLNHLNIPPKGTADHLTVSIISEATG